MQQKIICCLQSKKRIFYANSGFTFYHSQTDIISISVPFALRRYSRVFPLSEGVWLLIRGFPNLAEGLVSCYWIRGFSRILVPNSLFKNLTWVREHWKLNEMLRCEQETEFYISYKEGKLSISESKATALRFIFWVIWVTWIHGRVFPLSFSLNISNQEECSSIFCNWRIALMLLKKCLEALDVPPETFGLF